MKPTLLIVVLQLHLCGAAFGSQDPKSPGPRQIDSYGAIACDDAMARLDGFALKLQNEPSASGYIVVHPKRKGLVGKFRSYVDFAREYLVSTRGISLERVTTILGEYRDELTTELWMSSSGIPPAVTPAAGSTNIDRAWKFDEDFADYLVNEGKTELWTYDLCPLGAVNLRAFAEHLRSRPRSRGLLIIHPESGKSPNRFRTMAAIVRAEMVKANNIESKRIVIRAGKRRQIPAVELWVIP